MLLQPGEGCDLGRVAHPSVAGEEQDLSSVPSLSPTSEKEVLSALEGQLIDPDLSGSDRFRWQQLIVPGTLLAASTFGTYNAWYSDHVNVPVRDRMSEWTDGRQLHFDDYIQYIPGAAALGLVEDAYRRYRGKKIWLAIMGRTFTKEQTDRMYAYVREHGVI